MVDRKVPNHKNKPISLDDTGSLSWLFRLKRPQTIKLFHYELIYKYFNDARLENDPKGMSSISFMDKSLKWKAED